MDRCKSETLLKGKNIRATRQRRVVLDNIIVRNSSFCAGDLFEDLKGEIDLVTIYRNLQLLCSRKIIREVMTSEERQYYELSCTHNPEHPHFLCSSCRRIFCLKAGSATLARSSGVRDGFVVHEVVLQYRGICPDCSDRV